MQLPTTCHGVLDNQIVTRTTKKKIWAKIFLAEVSETFLTFVNLSSDVYKFYNFQEKSFRLSVASVKYEFCNLLNALAMQILHFNFKPKALERFSSTCKSCTFQARNIYSAIQKSLYETSAIFKRFSFANTHICCFNCLNSPRHQ